MISNIHNNQQNSHIEVINDMHIHELNQQQIFKMIKHICKKYNKDLLVWVNSENNKIQTTLS